MNALREKIINIVALTTTCGTSAEKVADKILALPEIAHGQAIIHELQAERERMNKVVSARDAEIERLREALKIFANLDIWEDAEDGLPRGIFRKAITGTAHPASIAKRALAEDSHEKT